MHPNAFIGRPEPPAEADLESALGPAKALWDQLLAALASDLDITTREWNSYSRKAGWAMRLKRGARAIVYLSPGRGCFTASFALGDKAVAAARASRLPKRVIRTIDEARKYAEGTAVRLEVKKSDDLAAVQTLAELKVSY